MALWWDGDGLCLFQKLMERGPPHLAAGHEWQRGLSRAQLSMLFKDIDSPHVERSWVSQAAV